ncbi:hypothetical protein IIA94_01385 [Patescibacteria group bacterium]|nr:hypothetical protein [Patescibacteria group bacterium]
MFNIYKISVVFITLVLVGSSQIRYAHAQFPGQELDRVFIELIQQFAGPTKDFPGPNEPYEAWVRSSAVDVNRASITWTHNGEVVAEGLGVKSYIFRTGDVGRIETLSITVSANGRVFEDSRTFHINDVDLLWQAFTTVPSWYKGKALTSSQSAITVTAFPVLLRNGKKLPPAQLVYRWSLDDDFKPESSGSRRRSFSFLADFVPGIEQEITVKVSDINNTLQAQKTIVIPVAQPKVLFYEERPLEGTVMGKALTNFILPAGTENTFRAIPYFFTRGAPLSYEWLIDGKPAREEGLPDILRLTAAAGSRGPVSISTTINNVRNILQRITDSFIINVQ